MSIPIANDFAAIAANMRNDTSERDAPGAGGPDAELLAMCIAFHRQNAAAQAVRSRDDDALLDAIDRRWEISDEIQNIPATTEAGRIAKALVAIVLLRESDLFSSGATTFAFATLLNVAGIVAPKSIPIQSPCSDDTTDEDLLGLPRDWRRGWRRVRQEVGGTDSGRFAPPLCELTRHWAAARGEGQA